MISPRIKNVIFDLGGVILNLSIESTLQQLARLTGMPLERIVESYSSRPEFLQYEKGMIDDNEFRRAIRNIYSFEGEDTLIDTCWNAMLLDIPPARVDLLRSLKSKYRTFLLSNTNAIHVKCFNESLQKVYGMECLDELFEKVYYSHILRMRKPDTEIYQYVLKENKLSAGETLFIDDNIKNIEGARSIGIQTHWIRDAEELHSIFS